MIKAIVALEVYMRHIKVFMKAMSVSLVAMLLITSVQHPLVYATVTEPNETRLAGSFYEWEKENSKYPFSSSNSKSNYFNSI